MNKIILILFIFFIASSSMIYAQEEENTIKIRTLKLDLSTLIFENDATIFSNIEFYNHSSTNSFGIEPSLSYVISGTVGGSTSGSPFTDVRIMAYALLGYNNTTTFKFLFGYCNRSSNSYESESYPVGQLRFGACFYWNLNEYIALSFKYSSSISGNGYKGGATGIGISIGWLKKD